VLQPLSRSERKEIRRPNFAMAPENESSREARADRRRARRQARQRERMMFWGGGALIVVLLVVVIIIAIRFR
jgi:predicted nucleic acid-binding Zn ribbon protein